MKLPALKIGRLESKFPVIQAGMGVRVGVGHLAGSVINAGGMGVVASVGLGNYGEEHGRNYADESSYRLSLEIEEARALTGGKGPLGVNVMVALTNYEQLIHTAVDKGVDFIISGAGLPIKLPKYVSSDTMLIPVISSGKGASLITRTWLKKYNRRPDAIIIEGPLCGGHLGFTYDQLDHPEDRPIGAILKEVQEALGEEHADIPLIAAEGVNTREDVENYIKMGFAGVQVGTRFICMDESGMDPKGQQLYIDATNDDVVVIKSPVGLPVRVLRSPLVERVLSGSHEVFTCPYKCLLTCDFSTVPFCIAHALIEARKGNIEDGLFMTGSNVEAIKSSISVADFFKSLE